MTNALRKLKSLELAPSLGLWERIEETLDRQAVKWKHQLVFSASALAVFAVLTFGGADYYNNYRLEQYLLAAGDYQLEYLGTFI